MYYLTKVSEQPSRSGLVLSLCLQRLGDFKRESAAEGTSYRVYRSRIDKEEGNVHGFYTVKDGRLVRDKRTTALHQIDQIFGGLDALARAEI